MKRWLLLVPVLLTGCGTVEAAAELLPLSTIAPASYWSQHLTDVTPSDNVCITYTMYGLNVSTARYGDMHYTHVVTDTSDFEVATLDAMYFYRDSEGWKQVLYPEPVVTWANLIDAFDNVKLPESANVTWQEHDPNNNWDWCEVTYDGITRYVAFDCDTGLLCSEDGVAISFLDDYPVSVQELYSADLTKVTNLGGYITPTLNEPVVDAVGVEVVDETVDLTFAEPLGNYHMHVVNGEATRDIYVSGDNYRYRWDTGELIYFNKKLYARTDAADWGVVEDMAPQRVPLYLYNFVKLRDVQDLVEVFVSGDLVVYNATCNAEPVTLMLDSKERKLRRYESSSLTIDIDPITEVPIDIVLPTEVFTACSYMELTEGQFDINY